jgi:hypothetical protein
VWDSERDSAEDQPTPSTDAVAEESEEFDQTAGESEPATAYPEPEAEEPLPAATDGDTGEDTADATGGGTDAASTTTSELEQAPTAPDVGSSQSRAPPAREAADVALVSAVLAELTAAPQQPAGYDRYWFPHWITRDSRTNRNRVLIYESNGTAATSSGCTLTSGQWYSHFDAAWVYVPRPLDIDHVVPLAEA